MQSVETFTEKVTEFIDSVTFFHRCILYTEHSPASSGECRERV